MRIRYSGHSLDLRLARDALTVRGRDGVTAPISLCVGAKVYEFISGSTRVFRLNDKPGDDGFAEKGRPNEASGNMRRTMATHENTGG